MRLVSVALIVLILGSVSILGAANTYHSYIKYPFSTNDYGNNVTAIVILKSGYLSVNAVISVYSMMGGSNPNITIFFPNGTSVSTSSNFVFHVHMNKNRSSGVINLFDIPPNSFYRNLSRINPIVVGTFSNLSLSDAENSISTVFSPYVFYVKGASLVSVSAVGESV